MQTDNMNTKNYPVFTMTFGISGSGKSSYVRKNNPNRLVVCPDLIRKEIFGDISNQSDNRLVWSRAIGRMEGALLSKKGVILDATNLEVDKFTNMIEKLPKCYRIAWFFDVPPALAFDRIQRDFIMGRERANVPREVVFAQYKLIESVKNVLPKYFDEVIIIK